MTNDDLRISLYQQLDGLRAGSLTFWGNWFGRPHDNIHRIVGVDSFEGATIIYFDHAETLIVEGPSGWSFDRGALAIQKADRVLFQWFYYGRLPSLTTLQFQEYRWVKDRLVFSTDFMPDEPRPGLNPQAPAVQIHVL